MTTTTTTELQHLTVMDVAGLLRVSRMTVYRLLDSGAIRSVHVGHCRRIPVDALRAYAAAIGGDGTPVTAG